MTIIESEGFSLDTGNEKLVRERSFSVWRENMKRCLFRFVKRRKECRENSFFF